MIIHDSCYFNSPDFVVKKHSEKVIAYVIKRLPLLASDLSPCFTLYLISFDDHFLGAIKCCCFSSDDSVIASCAFDHMVILWDAKTGNEVSILRGWWSHLLCSFK